MVPVIRETVDPILRMIKGYLFVVTSREKDVIYHKRVENFTGRYQAPYSCGGKVSIKQELFCTVLEIF